MVEINLLAELDTMDCWCGKDSDECEESGGCRWSNAIHAQGEKIGRLRQQVASLGGEVDGLKDVIARVHELVDDLEPDEIVSAGHIQAALHQPAQQGDPT